ncbi:unnamed protein product, partial [Pleuronectes platessa]
MLENTLAFALKEQPTLPPEPKVRMEGERRRGGTNTEESEGNEDELMEENIEAAGEIEGEESNKDTNNHE